MVAHGIGLGASSIPYGFAAATDPEYVAAAVGAVTGADIAVLYVPGIATLGELEAAQDAGANTVRVAVHCTEADCAEQPVRWARERGLRVMCFLMMSHTLTPGRLAEQARKLDAYGGKVSYVVDSAGAMVPRDAAARVAALRGAVDAEVGFHAHNNLGVGVANALVAADEGPTYLDDSLRGLGASAGSAQTEVLAAALERAGYHTGVDLFPLFDTAEQVVAPLMDAPRLVDATAQGSMAGFSGDSGDVAALAPGADRPPLDLPFERAEPARVAGGDGRSGRASGQGEPSLGLSADRGQGRARSGWLSRRHRCGRFRGVMVWGRHRVVAGPVGWNCCALKRQAPW
ncbi:4-hydroxy-2-oxovalerate aldolase [Pseudonocardia sp. Cha107L01]|uniref:4-hydroxy-2-oxovalerate aldolase n=1 Tax=Pseudonocardia sp. Cha107L01 TaxID=3457576 RepID=UPI00403EA895